MEISVVDHTGEFEDAFGRAVATALEACGLYAEGDAKGRCPYDTGRLRNSITHRVEGASVKVGTGVEYAAAVELGHRQEPGRYIPAIGKRLARDWIPAKPYLVPAITQNADAYRRLFETYLRGAR